MKVTMIILGIVFTASMIYTVIDLGLLIHFVPFCVGGVVGGLVTFVTMNFINGVK